jgi:hypothetical protein
VDTTGTPEDGGAQRWEPGEPASDEYSYGAGYGYGLGYGDPGDSGYGYGYGTLAPPAGRDTTTLPGLQAAAPTFGDAMVGSPQLPPVVGPTPALRGLPGGPGIEPVAADAGPHGPADHEQPAGSMWQRAQSVWSGSGIVWQRPVADWEPAEAEWERVQSAWTPPGRRRGRGRRGGPAADGRRPGGQVPVTAGLGAAGSGAAGPGAAGPGAAGPGAAGPGAAGPGAAGPGAAGPGAAGPGAAGPGAAGPGAAGPGTAASDTTGLDTAGLAACGTGRRGISSRAVVIGIAVVVAGVIALAVYLISSANPGKQRATASHPRSTLPVSPYPPAALAGADFTTSPSLATRGFFQSLNAAASYRRTVVAAGSEAGAEIGRTQFFVSTDAGHNWQLAPVFAADGGQPPTAEVPTIITAGPAGWLALGPGASWTSRTGRSWQLSAAPGIPLDPGDHVLAVTATAHGFLAAGYAAPHGVATPVLWTSPDGRNWQRASGSQLRLPAPGVVGAVISAAAHGDNTVIAAKVTTMVRTGNGNKKRIQRNTVTGLWRSQDGGATWAQVAVPVSHGAVNAVSGLAPAGAGFVVLRPGSSASGPEGVIYFSQTGSTWSYAGRITASKKSRLRLLTVCGSDQGAVIAATVAGGNLLAYASVGGQSWQQPVVLGNTSAMSLSSLTVLPGGSVVAAGAAAGPAGSQGFLAVAGASRNVVDLARIPGAAFTQRAVSAIAATPGLDVAVGSAGGEPAVWVAPPGHPWSRAAGAAPAVFGRPGLVALTSITAGSSGWLAVGGQVGGVPHPVAVFSPDGRTWQAADDAKAFAQPGAITSGVASHGSRYVIVGGRNIGGRASAAAWWSSGLGKWNRATYARKGALDGKGGMLRMFAVTAGSFGFVAIGQHGGAPAAWTSADGRAWRLIDLPAASGGGIASLSYVTASGNTVVAAGTAVRSTGSVPLVAVSTDGGLTWREITVPVPGNSARLTGLTATGSGFVAVGTTGAPGRRDVVVLTSADGTAWKPFVPSGTGLSGPGAQEITALTSAGGRLLGVGFTATAATDNPTLWVAPPTPAVTTGTASANAKARAATATSAKSP